MKKIFDRNGKKLKPSKVFVVYEVLREKLNSRWATTVGTDWSEIKKKKKHEEETEEKGTNGRRNEEEKTGGEKNIFISV